MASKPIWAKLAERLKPAAVKNIGYSEVEKTASQKKIKSLSENQ